MSYTRILIIFFIANCMLPIVLFSQAVKATVNRNKILIGEPIEYTVKASFDTSFKKITFTIPTDTSKHFEVIKKIELDSLKSDGIITYTQSITYTSFDSGMWVIPPLLVQAKIAEMDSVINLTSNLIFINVLYAPTDSTDQLRDIKPIMQVTVKDYFWYYVAGGALILLILIWLLWRYLTRRKNRVPAQSIKNILSPYEEAMKDLKKLQANNLNLGELKQYYVNLSIIFRRYFSRISGKNFFNQTTSHVLVQLNHIELSRDQLSKAASALKCGDAVKFAKFIPDEQENIKCKLFITEVIEQIHKIVKEN